MLDACIVVEILRDASRVCEGDVVDGRNMYAVSGSLGDRKMLAGLYGNKSALESLRMKAETAIRINGTARILRG